MLLAKNVRKQQTKSPSDRPPQTLICAYKFAFLTLAWRERGCLLTSHFPSNFEITHQLIGLAGGDYKLGISSS